MATLTRWLLRAFADEWPGGLPGDGDAGGPLYLEDRDNKSILEVDTSTDPTTLTRRTPSKDFDLNVANVLGVALTSDDQTAAGLGGQEYRAEPVLSVRIEAAPAIEHGHVEDAEAFYTNLVEAAREVVQRIDNGTLKAAPFSDVYLAEPGTTNPAMNDWKDRFTYQFDVEVSGYKQLS